MQFKAIEFGNELDEIEIKLLTPLASDAKSNSSIASDNINTKDDKPALMFDLTDTHNHRVLHGPLSSIMEQDVKDREYIHNNLVKFKKDTNQNKKNIYELAIKYLKVISKTHDQQEQQACIEVFPNVYLNLDNYTSCKTSNDGKMYLTNEFESGNIEVIIDDSSITINKKTPYQIIKTTYSRTINGNDVYSSLDQIWYNIDDKKDFKHQKWQLNKNLEIIKETEKHQSYVNNLDDKKNFKHLNFQLNEDLEIIKETKKRQSYINNLIRTAKYKKLYTPIASCGFDMFDQDRCCLCGKGCCDLDDVEIDGQEIKINH